MDQKGVAQIYNRPMDLRAYAPVMAAYNAWIVGSGNSACGIPEILAG
jgi:hypothetical protein